MIEYGIIDHGAITEGVIGNKATCSLSLDKVLTMVAEEIIGGNL